MGNGFDDDAAAPGPDATSGEPLGIVPLFPLPNVVLLPRAVLPLHIFEERYRAMAAHALAGEKRIAMALLRPGWEKAYYGKPAIAPVVCVGRILSWEKLPDGRYNFLLQGTRRARVVKEVGEGIYRQAILEPLNEVAAPAEALADERRRLEAVFSGGAFARTAAGEQFRKVLAGPMETPDVADFVAFNFFDDVPLKQSLLEEADVLTRVRRVVEGLEQMRPAVEAIVRRHAGDPSLN